MKQARRIGPWLPQVDACNVARVAGKRRGRRRWVGPPWHWGLALTGADTLDDF
jgi:hypothetical protein